MKKLKSLGRNTDLIFTDFEGEVVKYDNYWLVQTKSNPGYYWGNYIIFKESPKDGDYERWTSLFKEKFDYYDEIKHMVFAWDLDAHSPKGDYQPFLDHGFEFDESVVLTTDKLNSPPRRNDKVDIRVVTTDAEWQELLECKIKNRDDKFSEKNFREYWMGQKKKFHAMWQQEIGAWFGAYIKGSLVANLGVFHKEGLARYQSVETNADYRRQGICGTLVYEASQMMLKKHNIHTFVMEADPEYHAAKIYESVGFKAMERNYSLSWWQE